MPPRSPASAALPEPGWGSGLTAARTPRTSPPRRGRRPASGAAGATSGRSHRRARSRRRWRLAETRGRLQVGAAVACDERPQLDVRTMRVVTLQPGPDPRLVVPAVERRVLAAGEVGLELLERRQGVANEPPHGSRVRGLQRVRQLQGGPRLSLIDLEAERDVDGKEPLL